MNAWVKFVGQLPEKSANFGFKIQGTTYNDWIEECEADNWKWISEVGQVRQDGDANQVLYIFDSMKGPQTVRLS